MQKRLYLRQAPGLRFRLSNAANSAFSAQGSKPSDSSLARYDPGRVMQSRSIKRALRLERVSALKYPMQGTRRTALKCLRKRLFFSRSMARIGAAAVRRFARKRAM